MDLGVLEALADVSLSSSVIFSGVVSKVFPDVAAAIAFARRYKLEKKCRVTRAYSFWGGWFFSVRLEWRRSASRIQDPRERSTGQELPPTARRA